MSSLTKHICAFDYIIFRKLKAFEVREILDIIISFLDGEDLLTATLVCKTWIPTALDRMWRTLDSVIALFRLLGPMVLRTDGWSYVDTITAADWTRFELYSGRVRKIDNDKAGTRGVLAPGALAQVMNERPPSIIYLLPRVTEIVWTEGHGSGWLLQFIPLLSPTPKSFTLKMRSNSRTNVPDARVILRQLAFLPELKLQQLQARWPDSTSRLDNAVCDVLDRQREPLKSFSHQAFNLDEQLGTSLSQLSNLATLELKVINVNTRTDEDFNKFSNLMASSCPGLETIRFSIPSGPRRLTFHAFRPLTRVGGLREFCLECGDLDLKEKDFRVMGESWESLVALGFPNSRIPLPWFAAIAEHFSSMLSDININIQAPENIDPDCTIPKPFTALKRISYIEAASPKALEPVGSLLRRLVSPNTVVECAEWMEEPLKEMTGNSVKWKGERRISNRLFSSESPVS